MQEMQEQRCIAHRAGDIQERHDRRRLVDPPQPVDIDDVAAGAQRAAQGAAHVEPQAAGIRLIAAVRNSACGSLICAMARVTCAISADSSARNPSSAALLVGHRKPELLLLGLRRLAHLRLRQRLLDPSQGRLRLLLGVIGSGTESSMCFHSSSPEKQLNACAKPAHVRAA